MNLQHALAALGSVCAVGAVLVLLSHRRLLDTALVHAWYLQPADIREGYCGNDRTGMQDCWMVYVRGSQAQPDRLCWHAVVLPGLCGEPYGHPTPPWKSACMGLVADVCELAYGEDQ